LLYPGQFASREMSLHTKVIPKNFKKINGLATFLSANGIVYLTIVFKVSVAFRKASEPMLVNDINNVIKLILLLVPARSMPTCLP